MVDVEGQQAPALRGVRRVLGVEARLDRRAAAARPRRRTPSSRRRPTLGDGELELDEVDAGDQLGHRVLDLEPGVHLEEEEPVGVGVVEELDRAGAEVADRLGRRGAAALVQRVATSPVEAGRRAPPRRPSGGGAGSSSRARRGTSTLPCASPKTCTSTWRGARRTARRRRCRRRTRTRPPPRAAAISPARSSRRAYDAHAAPAAAGRRLDQQRAGRASVGVVGRLERRARRHVAPSAAWPRSWSPSPRSTRGVGPTQVEAGAPRRRGRSRRSRTGSRSRGGSRRRRSRRAASMTRSPRR